LTPIIAFRHFGFYNRISIASLLTYCAQLANKQADKEANKQTSHEGQGNEAMKEMPRHPLCNASSL
jgi:hypothetical protein